MYGCGGVAGNLLQICNEVNMGVVCSKVTCTVASEVRLFSTLVSSLLLKGSTFYSCLHEILSFAGH